jgi:hypothetical protein
MVSPVIATNLTMRTVCPSKYYSIRVPADAKEDYDGTVLSIWRDGESTALQLSSYVRTEGEQISANERLEDRARSTSGQWKRLELGIGGDCEVAAASVLNDGVEWWHCYLVTPQLAVYATLSFPEVQKPSPWALDAIHSIRFGSPVIVPV